MTTPWSFKSKKSSGAEALGTPSGTIPSRLRNFLTQPWSYPLLACFILVALLSSRKIGSDDIGFHLKTGEWIVQHLSFPQKDGFTYTQTNRDYLDSNGLYQVLLYGLYWAFGYSALTLMTAFVIGAVFFLLWTRLKASRAPPGAVLLLLLAAVLEMERRFIVRPEVFSWFYLSLTLWVLDRRFQRIGNLLFLLPAVQFLWVNTEGLFMLGWAACGIYLLSGRIHQKQWDRPLALYLLLSMAVDALNPYGFRGILFPFRLWTRLQDSNPYKQTIAEFFSPWRDLQVQNLALDPHLHLFLFFGLALGGLVLIALTFQERKCHDLLLFLVFLFLAATALRNIPLFTLVAVPVISSCTGKFRWAWLSRPPAALGLALLTLLWALRVFTGAYYISDRRNDRTGLGLDYQVLPAKACQFLAQNGLNGRMLNDLNSGGWLDWQAPQSTFMDGRLELPEDSFYSRVLQSYAPGGLIPLLALTDAQLVVMDYNSLSPWVDQLNRFSNWRLIYLDESTAVYARSDYAPQIPALSFPGLLTSLDIAPETSFSVRAQLQDLRISPLADWLRGFYRPQTYAMGDLSMGLFALRAKAYGPARDLLMEGFRKTNGRYSEIFLDLASAHLALGDLEMAGLCLEYTLRLDPQNKKVSEILSRSSGS